MESNTGLPPNDSVRIVKVWSWRRTVVLALFVVSFVSTAVFFREHLSLEQLAKHEDWLRQAGHEHPVLAYAVAFAVYVLITGLSIPGSAFLSLFYAWYFRFWGAVVLLSFASTTGATLAFVLTRYLFREAFQQRFADRIPKFNESLRREGAFYLFALRLTPVVPYVLINSLMGLTPMRIRTFWWVSQIGMLPGTMVYAYAGSTVPSLEKLAKDGVSGFPLLEVLSAFCLLGIFPIVARMVVRWLGRRGNKVSGE